MSRRVVEVTTGSRLHFGLMSFGRAGERQFGGVGAMIDAPAVRLRITAADELTVTGPSATLALRHAEAVARAEWFGRRPRCHIDVLEVPTPHVGLGSGTQLALAVVAGLNALYDREPLSSDQLARVVARGRRSAIGLYGFLFGGLVAEAGKLTEDEISPLVSRVAIPSDWRFLIVHHEGAQGLSGDAERQAFERLPPVPVDVTARMCYEAIAGLVPSAIENRFDLFSESLYRFGHEAGSCFAPLQGGIYASAQVAAVARAMRDLGIVGVGQSSWGPTVFAALPSQRAAEETLKQLHTCDAIRGATCLVTRPRNEGARIDVRQQ
jgi:beta-ribofuranosylaminobenzene 5'-phosphate synthase